MARKRSVFESQATAMNTIYGIHDDNERAGGELHRANSAHVDPANPAF